MQLLLRAGVPLVMLHALISACATDYASRSREELESLESVSLQYVQQIATENTLGAQIVLLPSDTKLLLNHRYSVVIFDPGPSNSIRFCEDIFELQSSADVSSFTAASKPALIVLYDRRPWSEIRHHYGREGRVAKRDCHDVVEHHDSGRAKEFVDGFELYGLAGPYLLSRDPTQRRRVLVDFSYWFDIYWPEAIQYWIRHVAHNESFWGETRSRNWARISLAKHYKDEYELQYVQIILD